MPISAQHTKFVYPDYVSPLPAEDLIKVALHKQEQFDQNVAKVQSQVDAYSQLRSNILKESERKYFDETMTKMVKAINDSAGVDFSLKANVQSVLNIGKPLEKDNIIINSIQSGKEYQRRQKTLLEMDQSKRNASNDWNYMEDAYNWLQNDQLGVSLAKDKAYDEFYDISEKVFELVKTFSKEEQEEFYSTGGGTPQGYIEKITQQGFSKNKLAKKIESMLATDPKAYKQLLIDTKYSYNNLGKERAHQLFVQDQTVKVAAFDERIADTKQQLAYYTAQNARVKSPTVQKEIDRLTENLQTDMQYRNIAFQNSSKKLEEFDPQDYFEVYKNDFITNLSNTYATQKISRDLKDDKVWDVLQARSLESFKNNLDIEKERVKGEVERKNNYDRMTKQSVVRIPATQSFLKNVSMGTALNNLELLENVAKEEGNTGAATNIRKFTSAINEAMRLKGTPQVKQLIAAIDFIKNPSKINAKYKAPLAQFLGLNINSYNEDEYVAAMNRLRNELEQLKKSVNSGIDSRTPISISNSFDLSLGTFEDTDLFINADRISDEFAIGMNPESSKYELDVSDPNKTKFEETEKTVKYGEEPPKPSK